LDRNENVKGIVPIENSSGGIIYPTADGIIDHACKLFIEEELSLDVKLALMSKKGRKIERIYSHFAPLNHCAPYIKAHYPNAIALFCDSTPNAAKEASEDENGAAIGTLDAAEIYGLDDILAYEIRNEIPNVTQFFLVGREPSRSKDNKKTSLVVTLPNHPGALVDFLNPFADSKVNLTRIQSRPVVGQPNTYNFLIELDGTAINPSVDKALKQAEKVTVRFHNVGSYPVRPRYQSR
jgi:prephenate dehydratase